LVLSGNSDLPDLTPLQECLQDAEELVGHLLGPDLMEDEAIDPPAQTS
jgi:hypothetical protein